jgi:hypothetical protein
MGSISESCVAMSKGFSRLDLAGKRQAVDATRYVTTTCTRFGIRADQCFIRVVLFLVLLVVGMASSSSAPALSKELHEQFGDTQGFTEHFIEQCASTRIL